MKKHAVSQVHDGRRRETRDAGVCRQPSDAFGSRSVMAPAARAGGAGEAARPPQTGLLGQDRRRSRLGTEKCTWRVSAAARQLESRAESLEKTEASK